MNEFGKKLKELRVKTGLTQGTLAEKLGMSFSTVSMYERGQRKPDLPTLSRIAAFFDVPLDVFSTLPRDEPEEKVPVTGVIPVYGDIPAGYPTVEAAEIIDYQPVLLPNPHEYFALRVHGDSMIGKGIPDGCKVVIRKQDTAAPGDIVACRINGYEETLKLFSQQGRTVVLSPANPSYQPIIIPAAQFETGEANIFGVVKQVIIDV